MGNTDHKITRSEAEYLRYRYKNMGVRESAARLCDAIRRSIHKRLYGAVAALRLRGKRMTFRPSYDPDKENIIVSLTSTPGRIRQIFPTLYSLMAQKRKPDLIVLWLGDKAAFPRRIISQIEDMGIIIRYRDDLGPNTKYHYAFREFKSDPVITVDDDVIYHEKMTEELYGAFLKHPKAVTARRVHKIRFDRGKNPAKYKDWIWEYRGSGSPSHELFATGVGGVLYPPAVMAAKCWENTDFLKVCPKGDDIWLKFCELSCGIKVCAVPGSRFFLDVVGHRARKTDLSQANVAKGRNDKYIGSCAKYFGMSDDLCEKVYGNKNT